MDEGRNQHPSASKWWPNCCLHASGTTLSIVSATRSYAACSWCQGSGISAPSVRVLPAASGTMRKIHCTCRCETHRIACASRTASGVRSVLRWLVRSMPLRAIAVMLLAEAGDPGFSYCARHRTMRVRAARAKQRHMRARAKTAAARAAPATWLTSSVRAPLRMSQPCALVSLSTEQPQRWANQRFAMASAMGLRQVLEVHTNSTIRREPGMPCAGRLLFVAKGIAARQDKPALHARNPNRMRRRGEPKLLRMTVTVIRIRSRPPDANRPQPAVGAVGAQFN
jgi:hypothetical protein